MAQFNNEEDKKIWGCLEAFDFSAYKNSSILRKELYNKIMESIGSCGDCVNFNKKDSFCRLLKIHTADAERCSDFEKVQKEDLPAFDVMTEQFTESQKIKEVLSRHAKYSHWAKGFPSTSQRDISESSDSVDDGGIHGDNNE